MKPIIAIYKNIWRHGFHLKNGIINSHIRFIKKAIKLYPEFIKNKSTSYQLRWLYSYENELRQLCLKNTSIDDLINLFSQIKGTRMGLVENKTAITYNLEKNQDSRHHLWLQHKNRRYDMYNKPPASDTAGFKKVQRLATMANYRTNFLRAHCLYDRPDVRMDIVNSILVPFWYTHNPRHLEILEEKYRTPRKVHLVSVKRRMGSLSLLRVQGIHKNIKGLRKELAAVSRDYYAEIAELEKQIKLISIYSEDPTDGEDMSEWISSLQEALKDLKEESKNVVETLDINRRIRYRKKQEAQVFWNYMHKLKLQEDRRQSALKAPGKLTLLNL